MMQFGLILLFCCWKQKLYSPYDLGARSSLSLSLPVCVCSACVWTERERERDGAVALVRGQLIPPQLDFKNASSGCCWWTMGKHKRISPTLRSLRRWLRSIHTEESHQPEARIWTRKSHNCRLYCYSKVFCFHWMLVAYELWLLPAEILVSE